MDEKIIKTLRLMAWERAHGELRSVLQTYWNDSEYETVKKKITEFIDDLNGQELG
jgi:hypothetical protein